MKITITFSFLHYNTQQVILKSIERFMGLTFPHIGWDIKIEESV